MRKIAALIAVVALVVVTTAQAQWIRSFKAGGSISAEAQ